MTHFFTRDKTYYKRLLTLAMPVAAQGLISFLASFADHLMVSSLGDSALSGVYFASQVSILLQMFTGGIGGVIVILSAQYWGKGDTENIKKIVSIGLRLSALVGAALSAVCILFPHAVIRIFTSDAGVAAEGALYLRTVAFSYMLFCITSGLLCTMRAVETPGIGMVISLVALGFDVTLNIVFIYMLRWGVFGAAFSTVIGRVAECAGVALYVFRFDKKLKLKLRDLLHFDATLVKDFVKYGFPLVAGELVWSVNLMGNSIIFGQFFGPHISTAVSIANTMNSLAYITISGFASAVGIITGKTVGAGKYGLMKEYARTTQVVFLCIGLLSGGLLTLLRVPFVSLYTGAIGGISADAAEEALRLIRVLSITVIGSSYQAPCLFGLVKSGGDISFVFKNDTIFVFCVVLPSALISAFLGAPAWVVFLCLKSDQILKCFVAVVKINFFYRIKNLTRETPPGEAETAVAPA